MTFQDVVSFLTRGMGMEENGQGWGVVMVRCLVRALQEGQLSQETGQQVG